LTNNKLGGAEIRFLLHLIYIFYKNIKNPLFLFVLFLGRKIYFGEKGVGRVKGPSPDKAQLLLLFTLLLHTYPLLQQPVRAS